MLSIPAGQVDHGLIRFYPTLQSRPHHQIQYLRVVRSDELLHDLGLPHTPLYHLQILALEVQLLQTVQLALEGILGRGNRRRGIEPLRPRIQVSVAGEIGWEYVRLLALSWRCRLRTPCEQQ